MNSAHSLSIGFTVICEGRTGRIEAVNYQTDRCTVRFFDANMMLGGDTIRVSVCDDITVIGPDVIDIPANKRYDFLF